MSTENKFTQGIWMVDDNRVIANGNQIDPVCLVYIKRSWDNNGNKIDDIEKRANAALISAAPDLLEALQWANKIIDRLCEDYAAIANHHANVTVAEANILQSAINKAINF